MMTTRMMMATMTMVTTTMTTTCLCADKVSDDTYKSLVLVHTLRTAASLLQHCCLESAIVHMANMQDTHPHLRGEEGGNDYDNNDDADDDDNSDG
jgi:hypothetical protein